MHELIPHSKSFSTATRFPEHYAQGEYAEKFAVAISEYFAVNDSLLTSSGTLALVEALRLSGITQGDEVILPSYACGSVARAVEFTGATPVFCDIGPGWTMTAASIAPHITKNTKAIIAVHIFGIACDIEAIKELGIAVIEDCAQSFGGELKGKKLGTIGDYGIFSFNGTKCLSTGEGGAVIRQGASFPPSVLNVMSDLQAAAGLTQLSEYEFFLKRRREIAGFYFKELGAFTDKLKEYEDRSMFFRFPLNLPEFDFASIKAEFEKYNVAVRHGVDALGHRIHKQSDKIFPNTVKAFNHTLSIPVYPALSDNEVLKVVESVKNILKKR